MLEKKTRAETEARLSVEKQLADLQAQKLEEAANTARSLTSRWTFSSRCFSPASLPLNPSGKLLKAEVPVSSVQHNEKSRENNERKDIDDKRNCSDVIL